MKQMFNVFRFEYMANVKSKAFIVVTVLIMALILGLANIPNIANVVGSFGKKSPETGQSAPGEAGSGSGAESASRKKAVLYDPQKDYPQEILNDYFGQYEWTVIYEPNAEWIRSSVESGEFDLGLEIDGLNYTQYRRGNESMFSSVAGISNMVQNIYRNKQLSAMGLSENDVNGIVNAVAVGSFVTLGKDLRQSYWIGYAMLMILYMTILMYGQYVSTSVIMEKSTKTMELLITSAKPVYLIFGKVLAAGMAGLTQLLGICLAGVVAIKLTLDSWIGMMPEAASILNLSATTGMLLYSLLFFLLGFFIFAFLYAACSSTVSRMEDARNVIAIPMMLFVAAFFVAMFSMSAPEAQYVKICSFVPFLSPLVMFMRICVSEVPVYQIIAAVAIDVFSIIVVGIISAKIYKTGVLMYGKPPKIKDLIKYMMKA